MLMSVTKCLFIRLSEQEGKVKFLQDVYSVQVNTELTTKYETSVMTVRNLFCISVVHRLGTF